MLVWWHTAPAVLGQRGTPCDPCIHLRSTVVRHRTRLFHTVVTSIVLIWGLECVPARQSDRHRLDSIAITMLSQIVWTRCHTGESGEDFFVRRRNAVGSKNAALAHQVWGMLAIRRRVAFAGDVARLPDARLVKIVQWDDSLPVWKTRQFLVRQTGGGHPLRHRGRGVRASVWEQLPGKLFEQVMGSWTQAEQDAWRSVHGVLPSNWWEGA